MEEAIGRGLTITDAQEEACNSLGIDTHEADFEVLQVPVKKALGFFGGKEALVKAKKKIQEKQNYNFSPEDPIEPAYQYLSKILKAFPINNLSIEKREENDQVIFGVYGEDLANLIGKHGRTLDSLQYLVNLVANDQRENYFRVKIDVSNYREKREKALETLGSRLARRAIKTRKKYPLEPMNPYDRRIVHMAVKKYKGVESVSQGDGIRRHIVIIPQKNTRINNNNNNKPAISV
jgi:spoIIIJ-associated protein